jgi:hypothetical protein
MPFFAAAASEPEASEQGSRPNLYVYVFAAAASEPEASEQGSSLIFMYMYYCCRSERA